MTATDARAALAELEILALSGPCAACQPDAMEAYQDKLAALRKIVEAALPARCSCTHEAGDSACEAHPTCEGCGDPVGMVGTPCYPCAQQDAADRNMPPIVCARRDVQWFDGPIAELPPRRPHITPAMLPEPGAEPEPTAADVERVARWLYSVFSGDPDWLDDWENWLLDEDRADWRNVARAAIGAGLDPGRVPR